MDNNYSCLFRYNYAANKRIIEALDNSGPPEKALQLMAHVLQAHHVWIKRIAAPGQPSLNPWSAIAPHTFNKHNEALLQQSLDIAHQHDDTYELTYYNTKGQQFCNKLADIYLHLVNHATYHRGQIALLLRLENIDPPVTDYIAYVTEKKNRPMV
ncbi:DinB family protein [Deminuibacter soli]|uniref:Damage-inducible protein DinB n=1 Tax=Deminuibacter soli TaxID=2291815 RepID=A0A3E1NQU6_9BACT|nr:DinB family protein [Deminuibacter soli]RFM30291.1 hypothetical protein DXN05_04820 [Deminuibacter soli]